MTPTRTMLVTALPSLVECSRRTQTCPCCLRTLLAQTCNDLLLTSTASALCRMMCSAHTSTPLSAGTLRRCTTAPSANSSWWIRATPSKSCHPCTSVLRCARSGSTMFARLQRHCLAGLTRSRVLRQSLHAKRARPWRAVLTRHP